jgi:hypothetical protein
MQHADSDVKVTRWSSDVFDCFVLSAVVDPKPWLQDNLADYEPYVKPTPTTLLYPMAQSDAIMRLNHLSHQPWGL